MPAPGEPPPSLRGAVRALVRDLRALGWRSARLARAETRASTRRLAVPLALLAGALVLATASLIALVATVVLLLAPLLGPLGAAIAVTLGTALAAGLLVSAAGRRLVHISFVPRRTAALLFGREPIDSKETDHDPHRRA